MGRTRIYSCRAEKQAAYRRRFAGADVPLDEKASRSCQEFHRHMKRLAADGDVMARLVCGRNSWETTSRFALFMIQRAEDVSRALRDADFANSVLANVSLEDDDEDSE